MGFKVKFGEGVKGTDTYFELIDQNTLHAFQFVLVTHVTNSAIIA